MQHKEIPSTIFSKDNSTVSAIAFDSMAYDVIISLNEHEIYTNEIRNSASASLTIAEAEEYIKTLKAAIKKAKKIRGDKAYPKDNYYPSIQTRDYHFDESKKAQAAQAKEV
jgi:hypothetical protein